MAMLMPGGPVGKALSEKTARNAARLQALGVTPTLEVIRVGQRPEDMAYERAAMKRAQAVGVQVRQTLLPADARPEELVAALERVNRDDSVHGCLLFRPLPEQLSAPGLTETLCPEKDVDGMTAAGLGGLMTVERGGFAPCTAAACMEMLRHYRIPLRGKNVTVVGTGRTVGMPLLLLLIQEDATVSACHLQTPPERRMELCRTADIIISAAGAAGVIDRAHLGRGQTIVDIGLSPGPDGELLGDVDFDAAEPLAAALTPKKGGVGAVTTAVLMAHTVEAAMRKCGLEESF